MAVLAEQLDDSFSTRGVPQGKVILDNDSTESVRICQASPQMKVLVAQSNFDSAPGPSPLHALRVLKELREPLCGPPALLQGHRASTTPSPFGLAQMVHFLSPKISSNSNVILRGCGGGRGDLDLMVRFACLHFKPTLNERSFQNLALSKLIRRPFGVEMVDPPQ
jgi:hypothetical protein